MCLPLIGTFEGYLMSAPALTATLPPAASTHYTTRDLAQLLQCSGRHVWRLIDMGTVPGVIRLGRLVRLHRPTIDRWLADGCPKHHRI
jgi:excisionase family DNA binding protein